MRSGPRCRILTRGEGDDYCNSEVKGRWYGYRAQDRPLYFNLNNCTEEQYLSLLDGLGMLDEALEDQRFANAGRDAVGLGRYAKEAQPVLGAVLRPEARVGSRGHDQ